MPGLPPRPRSPATAAAANANGGASSANNTPPASPRRVIPHAAQPPSPGIGAVTPQGSPGGGGTGLVP